MREGKGFYYSNLCYADTDSPFIKKKHWDVVDKIGLLGDSLCLGKNDYKSGGIFYALFAAQKLKYM